MLYNKVGLTNLGLSNNMITTGGARELAPCLEGLTKLQKLSMESNLIGNAGCNAIAQALKKNISLREIYLYNNELDDDTIEDFTNLLSL